MMKILVALNILFYVSKMLRIFVSYSAPSDLEFITPETCPTSNFGGSHAVMVSTYVAIAFSIFSQVSLVCVLNIILDNACTGSKEDFDYNRIPGEVHSSNVPYF
jgi:hypothetical protein